MTPYCLMICFSRYSLTTRYNSPLFRIAISTITLRLSLPMVMCMVQIIYSVVKLMFQTGSR